ncbi:MAG: ATP-binding domain-containing protein, partial [Acidimicrobiia bacterium]
GVANALLPAIAPDLPPVHSLRSTEPPRLVKAPGRPSLLRRVKEAVESFEGSGGLTAVIACDPAMRTELERDVGSAAVLLLPHEAKGLEFDNVVLVEPAAIGTASVRRQQLLYVALTRATKHLTIVHHQPLPSELEEPQRARSRGGNTRPSPMPENTGDGANLTTVEPQEAVSLETAAGRADEAPNESHEELSENVATNGAPPMPDEHSDVPPTDVPTAPQTERPSPGIGGRLLRMLRLRR